MSDGPIRLSDGPNFVEIRALERGPAGTPAEGDVRLGVAVQMDGFAGAYDQVWVAKDDWRGWLGSLRRLERERQGVATLRSMSPGELELNLQIIDRAGHLAAHGFLSRYHFGQPSGTSSRSRIEYHLGVDPSLLRELVDDFAAFGSSPGSSP